MATSIARNLVLGVLAAGLFAGSAAAQVAPVLNAAEVRTLLNRHEPADHARLSAHFTALAERYAAEADRHTSMAQSFGGNPNRSLGSGSSMHCQRLAALNLESAATLRELAKHHASLAAGAASSAPKDAARFEGGSGAPQPTQAQLNALAAAAATPADHRALQEYFATLARRYSTEAADHTAMAQTYRGTRIAQAASHCDHLVGVARQAATEASAAASLHEQMAASGR